MYEQILNVLQKEIELELNMSNMKPLNLLFDIYEPNYDIKSEGLFLIDKIHKHFQIDGLPLVKIRVKKDFKNLPIEIQTLEIKKVITKLLSDEVFC